MNNNITKENNNKTLYPYQEEGKTKMINFVTNWLRDSKMDTIQRNEFTQGFKKQIEQAFLLSMATGSGKTFTVSSFINELYIFREKYISMYGKRNNFITPPPLKVLILSHQKGITDQHKKVMFDGEFENGKITNPLLSEEIRKNSYWKVYHSGIDKYGQETGENITVEIFGDINNGHQFVFAVDKTAIKGLDGFKPNIIIPDEAHHINDNKHGIYRQVIEKYNKKDLKTSLKPLIIALTATPSDGLMKLIGKPGYEYTLAAFLASEYSPDLKYIPVSFENIPEELFLQREEDIVKFSKIKNISSRKEKINILKESINKHVKKFNSPYDMINHFHNTMKGDISQSLIYAKNIAQAEAITEYINQNNLGNAGVMHSKQNESSSEILNQYDKKQIDIIIAIGQMDEGMDSKRTFKNIVLMEDIGSPTKYKQRIGRGLRGKGILTIRDYACTSMANLGYISTINSEMEKISKEEEVKRIKKNQNIKISSSQEDGSIITDHKPKQIDMTSEDIGGGIKINIGYINNMIDMINKGFNENTAIVRIQERFGDNPSLGEMVSLLMMSNKFRNSDAELLMIATVLNQIGLNKKISDQNWFDIIKKTYVGPLSKRTEGNFYNALQIAKKKIKERKNIESDNENINSPEKIEENITYENRNEIKNELDPKYILEERGISFIELGDIILPTQGISEELQIALSMGDGKNYMEGENYNRLGIFLDIIKEHNLTTQDIIIGNIKKTSMRQITYVSLYVPICNKTVLLCNQFGNATFVLDGSLTQEEMTQWMKKDLKGKSDKIICKITEIEHRKEKVFESLLSEDNKKNHIYTKKISYTPFDNINITDEEIILRDKFIDWFLQRNPTLSKDIIDNNEITIESEQEREVIIQTFGNTRTFFEICNKYYNHSISREYFLRAIYGEDEYDKFLVSTQDNKRGEQINKNISSYMNRKSITIEDIFKTYPKMSHSTIANQLIDNWKVNLLMKEIHKFKGLDITVAHRLINLGFSNILNNSESFEKFDSSIASKLINIKNGDIVINNLTSFTGIKDNVIANQLIDTNQQSILLKNIDKFQGTKLDSSIAIKLIEKRGGIIVIDNLELFEGIDLNTIAKKLITNGLSNYFIRNINKFQGTKLDSSIAIKLINVSHQKGLRVINNLEKFQGIDHNIIAYQLIKNNQESNLFTYLDKTKGVKLDSSIGYKLIRRQKGLRVVNNLELFEGINLNTMMIIKNLIHSKQRNILVNNLHKFEGLKLDSFIAHELIDSEQGYILARNLDKFEGLKLDSSIAIKLVRKGQLSINTLARNLDKFEGLKLDSFVAIRLITGQQFYILARNLDKFQGLNSSIAMKLIDKGYGNEVRCNLESFKGLNKSLLKQIQKYI